MALYSGEDDEWIEDIYLLEQTDPVIGGVEGVSNKAIKELADRTSWLKSRMGHIVDEVILASTAPIPSTLENHLIVAYASGVLNLTLGNVDTFSHGAEIPISAFCEVGGVVNIKTSGGNPIYDLSGTISVINMHHKDKLCLIAFTDHFQVKYAIGNFDCAGEEVKSRKQLNNTLIMQGQLVGREQYPRLWKHANSFSVNQGIVSESTWFLDATRYRGMFSYGDGGTTFRLPDERGTFDRMLDLGRGIDISRFSNYPGGFELDELKSHKHGWAYGTEGDDDNHGGSFDEFTMRPDGLYGGKNGKPDPIKAFGGDETRPKNYGKLNLIKY